MAATCTEANDNPTWLSPYLANEPRILREVCRAVGRDDGGRHCASCCVRDLCEFQAERAGLVPSLAAG